LLVQSDSTLRDSLDLDIRLAMIKYRQRVEYSELQTRRTKTGSGTGTGGTVSGLLGTADRQDGRDLAHVVGDRSIAHSSVLVTRGRVL
jgi:hypothetical protein